MNKFIYLGMFAYMTQGILAGISLGSDNWYVGIPISISGIITALIVGELEKSYGR